MSKIDELKFDDKNFNKHTEYGMSLLEKSLRKFGGGRSILLDKNNNIIAGNGVVETANNIGFNDVQIVESDGSKLIAVKRVDVDINSDQGREMALADNAVAAADLEWDKELINETVENAGDWGVDVLGFEVDEMVDAASLGTVKEFDKNTNYDLKNLFRSKLSTDIEKEIKEGAKSGEIRPEIKEVLEARASQCSIFNFDEITKFYRSGNASESEKRLLEKLYLVFISPKEAVEKGIITIDKLTGEIYDNTLMESQVTENEAN